MVSKNSATRPVRSRNTVVEFDFQEMPKTKTSRRFSEQTGVYWNQRDQRWIVNIRRDYKGYHLGSFVFEDDAIRVAKKFIKENPCNHKRSLKRSLEKQRPSRGGSSKYKGVCRGRVSTRRNYTGWYNEKWGRDWIAQICVNYKKTKLGYFAKEIDAAKAYDEAAIKAWGDNAYTNQMHFPEDFKDCTFEM